MSRVIDALENSLKNAEYEVEEYLQLRDKAREKADQYQIAYEAALEDVRELKEALDSYDG